MRTNATRRASLAILAATLALPPSSLRAQTPPAAPTAPTAEGLAAHAAERKKAADQAMDALQYADALAAYADVFAITRDPALLYNMGRALQALNRFPEALEKLRAFEATASPELKARVPRLPKLIAEIREHVSSLTLTTNADGARILVRNTVVGKAPLPGPIDLLAGPADVEIEADGYFPAKRSVTLPGGAGLELRLDLFSRATTGVLSVKVSAPFAEVLVDGQRVGLAPVEVNVTKGEHKIVVRHPDYRVFETSAIVPAGGSKSLVVTLQSPPLVKRWWFWTAIGGVAAAGVGVAIAAVTERSPDTGTILPGRLHTGSAQLGAGSVVLQPAGAPLVRF